MSRIRPRNTGPELRLRSALWAAGLRYRIHAETPVGRPDIVFPARRLAVFIDGCFWHGCPQHYVRPRSHPEHWAAKLRLNVDRDRHQTLKLEGLGWRVVRVWEHAVYEELAKVVEDIRKVLLDPSTATSPEWRVVAVEILDDQARTERRYLEQLRNSRLGKIEEGRRITAKWSRP